MQKEGKHMFRNWVEVRCYMLDRQSELLRDAQRSHRAPSRGRGMFGFLRSVTRPRPSAVRVDPRPESAS